ncbi:hypothetical protein ABW20_dc0109158 [Dactylellina cionopaga]|nr:hypothetical protein ABW20_dc0109158 [Dactylellina cionopaga]
MEQVDAEAAVSIAPDIPEQGTSINRMSRVPSGGGISVDRDSGVGMVDNGSTIMASPTLGDEKIREEKKYATYMNSVFMAAAMGCSVEGYVCHIPYF